MDEETQQMEDIDVTRLNDLAQTEEADEQGEEKHAEEEKQEVKAVGM